MEFLMAQQSNPLIKSIPIILPFLLVGGALAYFSNGRSPDAWPTIALVAIGFGLAGTIVGVLLQATDRIGQSLAKNESTGDDFAGKVSHSLTAAQGAFVEQIKASQKQMETFTQQLVKSSESSQQVLGAFNAQLKEVFGTGSKEMQQGFSAHAEALSGLGKAWADEIHAVFKAHRDMLQTALDQLHAAGETWRTKVDASFVHHSSATDATVRELVKSLQHVAAMGQDFEKLLHVQHTIDATLENLSKTEDFKKVVDRLATHLEMSDKLLKEVTKPRAIRLVESHGDIVG
jgi:hypothetical protein